MTQRRMNARRRAERNQSRAAMATVIAVVISMAAAVGLKTRDLRKELEFRRAEYLELQAQYSEEQKRGEDLRLQRAQAEMPESIEKTAKEKLGLVNPDEILLKPEQ